MKRISNARLKSMEAEGAKVRRISSAPERPPQDPLADMVRQNAAVMQEVVAALSGITTSLSSIPEAFQPKTITKEVTVEVPIRIDYEFKVNRDDDGLVSTVDMMNDGRVAGIATFKRNKDHKVTSINTRKV